MQDDGLDATTSLGAISSPGLDPLFWRADRTGVASAWYGHVPFAHWLIRATAPSCVVELGTHHGVSYAAFCSAVQRQGLGARCFAIDTWTGDRHAGLYGEEVFEGLRAYHDARFGAFSTLIRRSFDDALELFPDGSIDLLHIDGLHTYEAVKHDFEGWRCKMSARGIVLFHDINVREGGFGVWRLWAELIRDYPSFEFIHGHGLGMLLVGPAASPAVKALAELTDPVALGAIRERFAQLGERLMFENQVLAQQHVIAGQRREEAERAEDLRVTKAELAALRLELNEARTLQAELDNEVATGRRALDEAGTAQARFETERAAGRRALDGARQRADALRIHEREQAAQAAHQASLALADAKRREQVLTEEARAAQVMAAAAQEELIVARAEARQAFEAQLDEVKRREAVEAALIIFQQSRSWKVTRPLRAVLGKVPLRLRRPNQPIAEDPVPEATPTRNDEAPACAARPAVVPTATVAVPAVPSPARLCVCCVSGEPDTPGTSYRIDRFAEAAQAAGARTMNWRLDELDRHEAEMDGIDVLFVWRARWSPDLARLIGRARANGARIVFDIDDLMIDPAMAKTEIIDGIRSQNVTEEAVREHYASVQQTMLASDLCIATTHELAEHMRRFGMASMTLPNGFSAEILRTSRMAARRRRALPGDGLVRLGYASGSRTHQRDFAEMAGILPDLLRAHPDCRLVLFQAPDRTPLIDLAEFPGMETVSGQIEWRDLVPLHRLPEEVARFDINLAPLELGNPFCEAKSELKYFEAALAGVCTVASPTGPFARAILDGVTGFLASTPAQWRSVLTRLIEQPELRQSTAAAALNDVLWFYGPERRKQQVRRMLAEWRGGAEGADAFALEVGPRPGRRGSGPTVPKGRVLFSTDRLLEASVTVVIPLYNYAHTVVETLESVRAQTLDVLDLVVVDDASTDASLQTVLAWVETNASRFNRVSVIGNHVNAGLAHARNAGFAAAETPYVLPLDADNLLRPTCCEVLLAAIVEGGTAYVYPVIQEFGGRTGLMGTQSYMPNRLVGGNFVDAMALIAKSAWSAVGGYHHVRFGWEDYDFWCLLAEIGLFGHGVGGTPLAEYRVHPASMLNTVTDLKGTKQAVIRAIEQRHSWVHVSRPLALPTNDAAALPGLDRLTRLLPILRCPETGEQLHLVNGVLQTSDGGRTWPMKEGRPVLYPGMATADVASFDHVSNELPDSALDIIRMADGLVLNLSAGGTAERFPNVVEVEAALFRHTDLVADSHALPFADEVFEAVIVMNAFEHYRQPFQAAAEIHRVLRPGGRLLVRTAFLQPQHEAPWHFFNATRHGIAEWFAAFETERLHVSENFNPSYAFSWLAFECEAALRSDAGAEAAAEFINAPVGRFVDFWRHPVSREHRTWQNFTRLTQATQEGIAAGFEYLGRRL